MLEESPVHLNKPDQAIDVSTNIAGSASAEDTDHDSSEGRKEGIDPFLQKKPSMHAAIEVALIVIGLAFIFLLLPRNTGGDGWIRYQDLLTALSHHTLYAPGSRYSLIGPAFALPLLLIGRHFGHAYDWILVYNELVFSFGLLTVYLLLKDRVDRSLLRKFFLLLIIASMFTAHLALFYGEVFTAICVGCGVLIACYIRFATPVAWLSVALGVANTPASLIGLALMLARRMLDRKRLRYLLVLVIASLFIAVEAYLRRGSFLGSGYDNDHGVRTIMPYSGLPGFSYPFFFGLLSILFSFGKGLLFFAPGLLLPVHKLLAKSRQDQLYEVYILWIYFLVGLILVYSRWWAWHGGIFWGPRFFLIASLPASLALAIRLRYYDATSLAANVFTFAVLCLSTWVGINGAVYQWDAAMNMPAVCTQNTYALEMLCYYTPEFSTLWLPFVKHIPLTSGQQLFVVFSLLVFAYLVTPLTLKIVQQLREKAAIYSKIYLKPSSWRF